MFALLNFNVPVYQWECNKMVWWLGLSIGLIHRGKVLASIRYPALVDRAEGGGRGNGWIKAGKRTWSSSPHFPVCWGSETVQHVWQVSIYVVNWGEPKCESLFCHSAEAGSASCMEAAWPSWGCMQAGSHKQTQQTTELYRHLQCVISVSWKRC